MKTRFWGTVVFLGVLGGIGAPLLNQFLFFLAKQKALALPGVDAPIGDVVVRALYLVSLLFISFLSLRFFRARRTHDGLSCLISDLHFRYGKRNISSAIGNAVASLFLILAKGIVGAEGIFLELLTGLGSWLGLKFNFGSNQIRALCGCGAVVAFSVVLGQPLTACLAVLEIFLGWSGSAQAMSAFAVASIITVVCGNAFYPDRGILLGFEFLDKWVLFPEGADAFTFEISHLIMPLLLVLLGSGLLAAVTIWIHRRTDQVIHELFSTRRMSDDSKVEHWFRLGFVSVCSLIVFRAFPLVFVSGIAQLREFSSPTYLWVVIALLMMGRILMSVACYIFLGSTGLFLPTLLLGAFLGALIAHIPSFALMGNFGTFVLLGLGSFFAAGFGAPITATALVFGIFSNYGIFHPQLLSACFVLNVGAHYLCGIFQKDRLGNMGLYRHGVRLRKGMCFNTLSGIQVKDAMITYITPLTKSSSLGEGYNSLMSARFSKLPVVDNEGVYQGMISLDDFYGMEAWKRLGDESQVRNLIGIEELMKRKDSRLNPEMNLETAVLEMNEEELMPVTETNGKFLGLLVRSDLVHLYNKEVIKKNFSR